MVLISVIREAPDGLSRDRQAVAMEDAGLTIHPSIFGWNYSQGFPKATRIDDKVDKAAGVDAKAWAGHRYGLQALKPALEPIIVAQKPYEGRPVDSIVATGAGALNIDGARIGTFGRWPANFYVDEAGAEALDAQSGQLTSGTGAVKRTSTKGFQGNVYSAESRAEGTPMVSYGDTGGASRFFFNAVEDRIDEAEGVCYTAKASRRERDAGLDDMPEMVRGMSNGAQIHGEGYDKAQSIGLNRSIKVRNVHPTVKPISLTRWLATLLLPPAEYAPRRLFVPFAGAGSECIGAMLAGWDEVAGVELMNDDDHPYVSIARARIAHWAAKEQGDSKK